MSLHFDLGDVGRFGSRDMDHRERTTGRHRQRRAFERLWCARLLEERGATPVESVFGLVLLVTIAVAIVQVSLVVYARNVVAAAAHEGARVAVERGGDPRTAARLAEDVVRGATGRLVDDLEVAIATVGRSLHIRVTGSVGTLGPLPFAIRVDEDASARLFDAP